MSTQNQIPDGPISSTVSEDQGFAEVMARARAKARGVPYEPTAADEGAVAVGRDPYERRLKPQHMENLYDLVDRWMDRFDGMPRDTSRESARPNQQRAADIRLGWYLPPRHRHDTLHNFRPITESQRDALRATCDWVRSVRAGQGGALALIGGVGTGKSHLLYAAIRKLNEEGIHAAAGGWCDLADLFRRAKHGQAEDYTDARQKKERILAATALGIDEIRPTSGTGYDTTELAQLMTRAYRECQGIIITSNFADEALEGIIGLAASSRLTQVVITGPDLRQPENQHYLEP